MRAAGFLMSQEGQDPIPECLGRTLSSLAGPGLGARTKSVECFPGDLTLSSLTLTLCTVTGLFLLQRRPGGVCRISRRGSLILPAPHTLPRPPPHTHTGMGEGAGKL